jgi:hypothetical protein
MGLGEVGVERPGTSTEIDSNNLAASALVWGKVLAYCCMGMDTLWFSW